MLSQGDTAAELAATHATEPLAVIDEQGCRFANQALANLVGVPLTELEGAPADRLFGLLEDGPLIERVRSALRQRQPFRGEGGCRTASGRVIAVELSVLPVSEAEPLAVIGFRDLQRTKRMEHQLRRTQRLDAVTRLADGIAHEMNNVIQVLTLHGGLLREALGADDERHADMATVEQASRRGEALLRELLELTRSRPTARRSTDLNRIIRGWEHLLLAMVGSDIRLILDLAPDLPAAYADRGEVQHILVNLVSNARDAMPDGGTLTIATQQATPHHGLGHFATAATAGYVMLAVADTGVGMSDETKANLFQPFFTTKDEPRSRGLGLATVHEIIREAGGLVWVRSQPGAGTSVEVHFPALPSTSCDTASPPVVADTPPRGSETILLVDDDPLVLRVTRRALEQFGYRVLAAESAAEATALAAERGADIALLVSDVMMPGQRGTGLARELKNDWPHLAILLMSGYPAEPGETPRLAKPFTTDELGHAVRAVLDA